MERFEGDNNDDGEGEDGERLTGVPPVAEEMRRIVECLLLRLHLDEDNKGLVHLASGALFIPVRRCPCIRAVLAFREMESRWMLCEDELLEERDAHGLQFGDIPNVLLALEMGTTPSRNGHQSGCNTNVRNMIFPLLSK